jgi:hypothetical protein
MPPITKDALDGYLGKPISDLCPNGYTAASDNHCAHFVSHVLGFSFGLTCGNMGHGPGPSGNIRVQELFPKCPMVGNWAQKPVVLIQCLVFITDANNVDLQNKTMVNVSRKHVGIYYNGTIWHYSNTDHKVVSQTPQAFSNHYPPPSNAMFYGTMPLVLNL